MKQRTSMLWRGLFTMKLVGCFLLFVLCTMQVQAQNEIGIKGIIKSAGATLPGVTVVVKGTTTGVITDDQGRYAITVPNKNAVLVISYLGYLSQEILVGEKQVINVELKDDTKALEEVVVVGYGSMRKSDVTGSVASLGDKDLRTSPVANVSQALQGRVTGVSIQSTSTRPGETPQIRIRGTRSLTASNDPLMIVDGIPFEGSINDLNPDDIKSMEILKDASATAIYGSRGANGVILISTQRGGAGKTHVSYNAYVGMAAVSKKYPVFNAQEFQDYRNLAAANGSQYGRYVPQEESMIDAGLSTDWQDLIYKHGAISNQDLTISGGSENTQASMGLGYYNETAVVPGQDFKRYSLRATIDQKISTWLKVGFNSQNSFGTTDGESVNYIGSLIMLSPVAPAYNDDGSIYKQPVYPNDIFYNPLLMNNKNSWMEQRKRFSSNNSLYTEVQITKDLKYRMNLGLTYHQDNYGNFYGSDTPMRDGKASIAEVNNSIYYGYTVENLLYYNKVIKDKHRIGATLLYSAQDMTSYNTEITSNDIIANYIGYFNMGLANGAPTVDPSKQIYSKRGLLSYMGRLNYSYDDRYMATLTFRSDGSSVLAPGNQWHSYPAIAFAWNAKNESFMKGIAWLDLLKVRVGYGQTSNQGIAPYTTMGRMSQNKINFGPNNYNGYYMSSLANPDLGWEYTNSYNAGVDFAVLNNRISGTVDLYYQHTKDLLLNQSLPPTSGVPSSILKNVGETENKGLEISLSTVNIASDNKYGFNWTTDFNFSLNRNKLLALNSGVSQDIGNSWFVGQPVNVVYDYKKVGIWQTSEAAEAAKYGCTPGQIKVDDYDHNGSITPDDRQIYKLDPKFEMGMTNRITYKRFDMTIFMFSRVGGTLISTIHQPQSYMNELNGARNNLKVDYWTVDNPTNDNPTPSTSHRVYGSTLGYFSASFMKIKTMSLGYTFDGPWMKRYGITNLRLYTSCNNVGTFFSDYMNHGGVDPEPTGIGGQGVPNVGSAVRSNVLTIGLNTPPTRQFIFGINLKFQ